MLRCVSFAVHYQMFLVHFLRRKHTVRVFGCVGVGLPGKNNLTKGGITCCSLCPNFLDCCSPVLESDIYLCKGMLFLRDLSVL